jgi:hypothetical protein
MILQAQPPGCANVPRGGIARPLSTDAQALPAAQRRSFELGPRPPEWNAMRRRGDHMSAIHTQMNRMGFCQTIQIGMTDQQTSIRTRHSRMHEIGRFF